MGKKNAEGIRGLGFIDRDLIIEGSIHSQKKMVVSGTVKGTVSGNQEIVVSETGQVDGIVQANKILVAGKVVGKLSAHKRLEIISTANINGNMEAPSGQILIQEGANLDAKCKTIAEDKLKKQLTT